MLFVLQILHQKHGALSAFAQSLHHFVVLHDEEVNVADGKLVTRNG